MSASRITLSHQLAPSVAFAVRRAELGWIIVVNPGLIRADRIYAEALANQLIDSLESGWEYQPPAGGADVLVSTNFTGVARVVDHGCGGHRDATLALGRMAAAFALPLTACAWIANELGPMLLGAPGIGV